MCTVYASASEETWRTYILEELEKLAVELGHTLLKMVVKCSAESLSMKQMERDTAAVHPLVLNVAPKSGGEYFLQRSNLTYSCAHTLLSLPTRQSRPFQTTHTPCALSTFSQALSFQHFMSHSAATVKGYEFVDGKFVR
jgi:hypothetical protein